MKAPKYAAPAVPDPKTTADAQTQSNQETANYQAGLNQVNQITPYGNLTYSGTNNGQPGSVTAYQTLSPDQQKLLEQTNAFDSKSNAIGLEQLDKVGGILSQPVNLNNEATEARLMELGSKRLDPMFERQSQQLEQDLLNRGIRPGSEAYSAMRGQFDQGKNDAYNQLLLSGRGQAVQEALTERNQPLNEITGLMNGQQISQPNFINSPQTNVNGTDVAGITMDAARMNQQNYNTQFQNKSANYQSTMGGLFGLGSSLLGGGSYILGKK